MPPRSRRPVAAPADEHDEQAQPPAPASVQSVLALQRGAGNAAVTGLLARKPDPSVAIFDVRGQAERAAEKNPQLTAPKKAPAPKAPEHSSRSDATSYNSQPDALKEVLVRSKGEDNAASWFSALSDEARSNLVYTYNRMVEYGIWQHVKLITGVEEGERPVNLGPLQFHVAGKSQSVLFEVYDNRALRETMIGSGKFGKDVGPAGALHPGQTSMREWTTKTADGLHLSIGASTAADAHIDKRTPTGKPKGGVTQMELVPSLEHHWQEVWPEFIRAAPGFMAKLPLRVYEWLVDKLKYFGAGARFREALKLIPRSLFNIIGKTAFASITAKALDRLFAGTTFKPAEKVEHPDPSQREKGSDIVTIKEYKFGSKGKPARAPVVAPAGQSSLDEGLEAAVTAVVSRAAPVVKPSAGRDEQGNYADTGEVARAIAGKIMYRAKKGGGPMIELDLGEDYHRLTKTGASEVKRQLETIGKAAHGALVKELKRRGDEDLAQAVTEVRSGSIQLGPAVQYFALH